MQVLIDLINTINGIVWGLPMIILILGTGLYLQFRLGFMPIRKIVQGLRMIWNSRTPDAAAKGEISPFAALMTALSATVGTGNIVGV
ncbi:MAG: alanine:cation symporter family protein, partial [Burkholderiaceae bacterium]